MYQPHHLQLSHVFAISNTNFARCQCRYSRRQRQDLGIERPVTNDQKEIILGASVDTLATSPNPHFSSHGLDERTQCNGYMPTMISFPPKLRQAAYSTGIRELDIQVPPSTLILQKQKALVCFKSTGELLSAIGLKHDLFKRL